MEGSGKILPSLQEALLKCGVRDGMVLSFHHHFRDGDDNAKLTSLKVDGQTVELKDDVYEYRVDVNKAKEVALEVVANASAKVAMSFEGKVVKDNKVTCNQAAIW